VSKLDTPTAFPEVVDIEEDPIDEAWCVAPTEACSFVAIAVFAEKKDAELFLAVYREKHRRGRYDDLVILPARAHVQVANTFDVEAGRKALDDNQQ
jgi:hypothetical protein